MSTYGSLSIENENTCFPSTTESSLMPYEGPEKFDAMANAESAKKKDFVPATKTLQNKLVKARGVAEEVYPLTLKQVCSPTL